MTQWNRLTQPPSPTPSPAPFTEWVLKIFKVFCTIGKNPVLAQFQSLIFNKTSKQSSLIVQVQSYYYITTPFTKNAAIQAQKWWLPQFSFHAPPSLPSINVRHYPQWISLARRIWRVSPEFAIVANAALRISEFPNYASSERVTDRLPIDLHVIRRRFVRNWRKQAEFGWTQRASHFFLRSSWRYLTIKSKDSVVHLTCHGNLYLTGPPLDLQLLQLLCGGKLIHSTILTGCSSIMKQRTVHTFTK